MVEVRGLTKCYGEKVAVDNISFSVQSGEVVGLLGLNGAGKSTTMNILTGYLSATSGSVSIDGHDIADEGSAAKRVTGYLPEQPSFYPEMRVDEALGFICDLKGVTKKKDEREAHVAAICKHVGIADIRRRMVKNLSKGYKQRVAFAQALVGSPKVLILDEPTVGLDPSQIIEIRSLIKESGKESTVIVSSHILSEIQAICTRVIVLHGGKIIADDTPQNLANQILSTSKLKIRVAGEPERVLAALEGVDSVQRVRALAEAEPGAYDYAVDGKGKTDIRADVFHALAKADLPLLFTHGNDLTLEDVFLSLVDDAGASTKPDKPAKPAGQKAEAAKPGTTSQKPAKPANSKPTNGKPAAPTAKPAKKEKQK